ncbi:MAG: iron ABC transporter substrate-binding protein [Actinobacteria bacterium]|nr:iron ABC transporter substrate-binding protein [Actinomycetota bacterium]
MTRRTTRATAVLAAALVLSLAGSACTGTDDELVIYSGRTSNLVGPLLERFAEATGTNIAVKYGDSAELALTLGQEGEASDADVFLAQNPGAVAHVGDEGLLATLPAELLDDVDPAYRSENDRWVGVSGRQRVIVYNADLVDPADLPASVFDITLDEYEGRVAIAPQNGSFQDFVSAMVVAEGEDTARRWLQDLAEGGAPTYANNNAIVEAVSRGEVPMGLVNHYYNHRFLAEDPDLPSRNGSFEGDDLGNLVIASSVSIIAGTDQQEAAERFVAFLLSEEAQRYFSEETFEYPLAAGVEPSGDVPPIDPSSVPRVDFDQLGANLQRTTSLIREVGLT